MILRKTPDGTGESPGRTGEDLIRALVWLSGLFAIAACLIGIIGNLTGIVAISSVCAGCKTLALSAALAWIFFGAVLVLVPRRPITAVSRTIIRFFLVLIACLEAADIISVFTGSRFIVERWFVSAGTLLFGPRSTPISPVASVLIIIAAVGFFAWTDPGFFCPRRRHVREIAVLAGSIVMISGFTLSISYLFGSPLLFAAPLIPVAAFSAIAAFFIGFALVLAAGPKTFPVRLFIGTSIRARLLRTFVPLTIFITLCETLVFSAISSTLGLSNEIMVAGSLVLFIAVTAIIAGRLSGVLGRTLDAAEQELAGKNAELEKSNEDLVAAENLLRQNIVTLTAKERDLREIREQLTTDLESMDLLRRVGMLYIHEDNLQPVLFGIVSAAMGITRADFGNIQLVDPSTSRLKIMAYHGFPDWWVDYWNTSGGGPGSCGTAQKRGERVIVEDVERSEIFAGTPTLEIQLRAGIRAVQSTPIMSRDGKLLGMFSTHFKEPHRPDDRQLAMLDLLALLTADIIERVQSRAKLQWGMEVTNILADSARMLMSTQNPERVVPDIGERVMKFLDCHVFFNYLTDETGKRIHLSAYAGISRETAAQMQYPDLGETVCGCVARDGVRRVISDVPGTNEEGTALIRSLGTSAYACYPMVFQGRTIGTMSFGACNRMAFTPEHLDLMQAVTDLVTSALARKKIEDALRDTSQYLENLIRYANAPIIVWDTRFRILRFNHAFEFLTGMQANGVIGEPLEILFPEQSRKNSLDLIRKTTGKGERWESVEIPIRHTSGAVKIVLWNSANIYGTDGVTIISTIAQGQDITRRTIAEKSLQESVSLLSAALDSTADGILVVNLEGRITIYNQKFCTFWGVPRALLDNAPETAALAYMILLVSDRQAFIHRRDELYAHPSREGYDVVTLIDGRVFERYSKPQKIGDMVIGRVWSYRDITERRQAEQSLQESLEKFRIIATSTPDHILVQDKDLRYTEVINPQLGLTVQEMLGNTDYDILSKEDADSLTAIKRKVLETGTAVHSEVPIVDKYGVKNYFTGSYIPKWNAAGEIDGIIGYFSNITEKKQANEKIFAALAEKEVLIREIHHRVKNNLQIITGLLDMTRSRAHDAPTREILTDMMLKIRTMAQIHTRLYECHQSGRVNMGEQIRDMVAGLSGIYGKSGTEVDCTIEAGDFSLDVDQAVPCALAVNEILSNSFKHAFKGRQKGTIHILARHDPGAVHIQIEDNGTGIPADVDPERSSSLGLKLIRNLVRQLQGTVSIENTGAGTRVTMDFPEGYGA